MVKADGFDSDVLGNNMEAVASIAGYLLSQSEVYPPGTPDEAALTSINSLTNRKVSGTIKKNITGV